MMSFVHYQKSKPRQNHLNQHMKLTPTRNQLSFLASLELLSICRTRPLRVLGRGTAKI